MGEKRNTTGKQVRPSGRDPDAIVVHAQPLSVAVPQLRRDLLPDTDPTPAVIAVPDAVRLA